MVCLDVTLRDKIRKVKLYTTEGRRSLGGGGEILVFLLVGQEWDGAVVMSDCMCRESLIFLSIR